MMRSAAFLALLVFAAPVLPEAQDTDAEKVPLVPLLRVEFPETEAIPGQSLSLRMTVLVPTFMPKPPVWPTLEAANLLVRLPERSTNPTSERIDGETWSGLTRNFRVSPMVPGQFSIQPQQVIVTWRDPTSGAENKTTLTTQPIAFTGMIPEGAESLDPFIAANDLTLTQEIEGKPVDMVPGDSVTRTITASIEGASPMFLPRLQPQPNLSGVAAYPDEPILNQHDARGLLTGTRVERVSYVAEGGGGGVVPEITLKWFDIDDKTVKTARVDGLEFSVEGPPATQTTARDWRSIAALVIAAFVLAATAAFLLRLTIPAIRGRISVFRETHRASEGFAWRQLKRTLNQRDYVVLASALEVWWERAGGSDPLQDDTVKTALLSLGAARYGQSAPARDSRSWDALERALTALRKRTRAPKTVGALRPLNPGHRRAKISLLP
ncbi:MAG: hypothetical protein AAGB11_00845 [Pseudomonadota bacterium]